VEPKRLYVLREQLGFTQEQLAAALGVHPMTVSRWERGARQIPEPVARLVERLATERKTKKRKR
jgi:transcriptional regulator with XRE-family HTH domain